ncbi:hypothetical protein D9M68_169670 [compost metagenome]
MGERLAGEVAVVTGHGSGIGHEAACSRRLAKAFVHLSDRRQFRPGVRANQSGEAWLWTSPGANPGQSKHSLDNRRLSHRSATRRDGHEGASSALAACIAQLPENADQVIFPASEGTRPYAAVEMAANGGAQF